MWQPTPNSSRSIAFLDAADTEEHKRDGIASGRSSLTPPTAPRSDSPTLGRADPQPDANSVSPVATRQDAPILPVKALHRAKTPKDEVPTVRRTSGSGSTEQVTLSSDRFAALVEAEHAALESRKSIKELQKQLDSRVIEIEAVTKARRGVEQDLEMVKARFALQADEGKRVIEDLKRQVAEGTKERSVLKAAIEKLEATVKAKDKRIAQLETELAALTKRREGDLAKASEMVKDLRAQVDTLNSKLSHAKERHAEDVASRQTKQDKLGADVAAAESMLRLARQKIDQQAMQLKEMGERVVEVQKTAKRQEQDHLIKEERQQQQLYQLQQREIAAKEMQREQKLAQEQLHHQQQHRDAVDDVVERLAVRDATPARQRHVDVVIPKSALAIEFAEPVDDELERDLQHYSPQQSSLGIHLRKQRSVASPLHKVIKVLGDEQPTPAVPLPGAGFNGPAGMAVEDDDNTSKWSTQVQRDMLPPMRPSDAAGTLRWRQQKALFDYEHVADLEPSAQNNVTTHDRRGAVASASNAVTAATTATAMGRSQSRQSMASMTTIASGESSPREEIPVGPADTQTIESITRCMIGMPMYKYTRRTARQGLSENRHRRYVWLHPYTRTLYWSVFSPMRNAGADAIIKSAPLLGVHVENDYNPHPPGLCQKSIYVSTTSRVIKLTALQSVDHDDWVRALDFLINGPAAVAAAVSNVNVTTPPLTDLATDGESSTSAAAATMSGGSTVKPSSRYFQQQGQQSVEPLTRSISAILRSPSRATDRSEEEYYHRAVLETSSSSPPNSRPNTGSNGYSSQVTAAASSVTNPPQSGGTATLPEMKRSNSRWSILTSPLKWRNPSVVSGGRTSPTRGMTLSPSLPALNAHHKTAGGGGNGRPAGMRLHLDDVALNRSEQGGALAEALKLRQVIDDAARDLERAVGHLPHDDADADGGDVIAGRKRSGLVADARLTADTTVFNRPRSSASTINTNLTPGRKSIRSPKRASTATGATSFTTATATTHASASASGGSAAKGRVPLSAHAHRHTTIYNTPPLNFNQHHPHHHYGNDGSRVSSRGSDRSAASCTWHDLENVRECCDGRHDVGLLSSGRDTRPGSSASCR